MIPRLSTPAMLDWLYTHAVPMAGTGVISIVFDGVGDGMIYGWLIWPSISEASRYFMYFFSFFFIQEVRGQRNQKKDSINTEVCVPL